MADIISADFVMPRNTVMILPDENKECVGTVVRSKCSPDYGQLIGATAKRVVFVKEQAQEVKVDNTDYFLMHADAVVGVLPE